MKRILATLLFLLAFSAAVQAQSPPPLTIREADGLPRKTSAAELVFPNGSLTQAGGKITVTFGGGSGTLTASGLSLPINQLVLGNTYPDTKPLGSLGTTITVLHGNAAGAPTFGAVSLTADVSGILPTANGGTGIAFFTVAGPTVARVFTFPDAAATVLTTNAAVTVAQGGVGQVTYTKGDLLTAPGGASLNKLGVGTDGFVLTADAASTNGVKWAAGGGGLTVGTTTIASGTTTRILYDNAGALGEYTLSGSGTVVAMGTSPNFLTSVLGNTTSILTFPAAATWQLGAADVDTAPVAQILTVQNALTGGTADVAGANLTIKGSQSKGTGLGGSIIFQVANKQATGTVVNALGSVLTLAPPNSGTTAPVNGITITNAITTASPIISATGSDTNINIVLTPQGTGSVKAAIGNTGLGTSAALLFGAGGQGFSSSTTAAGVGTTGGIGASTHFYLLATGNTPVDFLLNTSPMMTFNGDVGLARNAAAAQFAITNGTLGQWGSLLVGVHDAGTTTVTNGLTVGHQSTGTPAAGLGSAVQFNINSSTTADQNAAQIYSAWEVATHATREAYVGIKGLSGLQTLVDRQVIGASKVLANNTGTPIVNVTAASNTVAGGVVDYSVEVFDGTNLQIETGSFIYQVINKGGAFSANTITSAGASGVGVTSNWPVNAVTSGTLACTWTITAANPAVITLNANSSLTPSTGYPRVTYNIRNHTQQVIAVQ